MWFSTSINGKLSYGNRSSNLLEGFIPYKPIFDLVTAMSNENTYVNVHTEQHPNDEIRGQIMSGINQKTSIHT